jgi:hypothetical protein
MLAPLAAYLGVLALFVIVGMHAWNEFPAEEAQEPSPMASWSAATRSYPAFAVIRTNSIEKTEAYEVLRHPEGGRKDVFHWSAQDGKPAAELELYRIGGEWTQSRPAIAELADRMAPGDGRDLESAGIIDSKFGAINLLRVAASPTDNRSCLGFVKRFYEPNLQISGWSCQGASLPARRAAIGCILNQLTLLTAVNEPKLPELFAKAELKRSDCSTSVKPMLSADWVTGVDNPRLRGAL